MAENKLANIVIGIAGTGRMGGAHAFRHSQLDIPVIVGSRDAAKAQEVAERVGKPNCTGTTLAEMIEKANFIIVTVPSGNVTEFFDTHRDLIVGKGKMFNEISSTFSKMGGPDVQPPTESDGENWKGPYFDMCNYQKDRLNDPSTQFVKCFHNLYYKGIEEGNFQPVEYAGDAGAKEVAEALMLAHGYEPLDCGGMEDIPKIETGFHERRVRHPRHIEYNGPEHP